MTVGEALREGAARLRSAGVESPGLDAALLLAFALKTTREKLLLTDRELLSGGAAADFGRLLERRASGECAAYILGFKEFRGLDFAVTPDVLVPRPDTETLVEAALAALPPGENTAPPALLDLCTGSGAVAIALKHERPFMEVYAADISPGALAVARKNALRLLGEDETRPPVHFLEGDLFEPVPPLRFDLIVANPPYVPAAEIPRLSREVRFEPRLALDGGEDGLVTARRIAEDAPAFLKPGGRLLLEADPRQMQALALILKKKRYRGIALHRDLSGLDRVIEGVMPPAYYGNKYFDLH
ncbi:MAG: peptide chain release factor N(5)-glutamine methyltransferase [Treponema sp.]|jgi:release factor glutamine methyltransferase|nr:peptide chain release factor N(5)-glutamine methyltransferase [Treponema sp.]